MLASGPDLPYVDSVRRHAEIDAIGRDRDARRGHGGAPLSCREQNRHEAERADLRDEIRSEADAGRDRAAREVLHEEEQLRVLRAGQPGVDEGLVAGGKDLDCARDSRIGEEPSCLPQVSSGLGQTREIVAVPARSPVTYSARPN